MDITKYYNQNSQLYIIIDKTLFKTVRNNRNIPVAMRFPISIEILRNPTNKM